jgi:aryl-alcohol dehydrogenase-like predicted oxidoreductase
VSAVPVAIAAGTNLLDTGDSYGMGHRGTTPGRFSSPRIRKLIGTLREVAGGKNATLPGQKW